MSHHGVANVQENMKFKSGIKIGVSGTDEDIRYYESFTCHGMEYLLYDCAYFYRSGDPETSIGKLVKIYETPTQGKRVKVVWFFRPSEVRNFFGEANPHWNELFLASGEGKGLYNINSWEAVVRKCNVVCTTKDERNPRASEADLKMADYFLYRTFDVGKCIISEDFAADIAGIKVDCFFNWMKDLKLVNPPYLRKNIIMGASSLESSKLGFDRVGDNSAKDGKSGSSLIPAVKESKKAMASLGEFGHISKESPVLRPKTSIHKDGPEPGRISSGRIHGRTKVRFSDGRLPKTESDTRPYKKRRLPLAGSSIDQKRGCAEGEGFDGKATKACCKAVPELAGNGDVKTLGNMAEITGTPNADRGNCFKQLSWEHRLQAAEERGTLVLLENLDPSYTSLEVEEKVNARMIEHSTFSHPNYGKAFVIFKTKVAADSAILEFERRCLILANGRTVIACRGTLRQPGKPTNFLGHMVIPRIKHQQGRDERNAVSTSHSSQPNTLEYDLAMQWRGLQVKSDKWRKALFQAQAKEMQGLRSRLKLAQKQ